MAIEFLGSAVVWSPAEARLAVSPGVSFLAMGF